MDFCVGDRVRFKDLETIKDLEAHEKIRYGWHPRMNPLCGMEFTISKIDQDGEIHFKEDAPELHCNIIAWKDHWNISEDMIEYVDKNPGAADEIIADNHFFDMLLV